MKFALVLMDLLSQERRSIRPRGNLAILCPNASDDCLAAAVGWGPLCVFAGRSGRFRVAGQKTVSVAQKNGPKGRGFGPRFRPEPRNYIGILEALLARGRPRADGAFKIPM